MPLSDVDDFYVLSPLQEGMLYHSLAAPASGVYVDQFIFELAGDFDAAAFRRAWQQAIDCRAVLRTSFHWDSLDRPLQVVHRGIALSCTEEDWRQSSSDEQARRLDRFLTADRTRGFELDRAPLFRLALFRTADTRLRVVWTVHHIILDGWSTNLLQREVLSLYEASFAGRAIALAPDVPMARYLEWRRQQNPRDAEAFWTRALHDYSSPTLVAERRGTAAGTFALRTHTLSAELSSELRRVARGRQLTESTLVNAAWGLVLGRYCGAGDVVFGVTVAGRPAAVAEIETLLGNLINTVPLRLRIDSSQSVRRWLSDVQERQLDLQPHAHASLADLQRWARVRDGLPLFDSVVTFENLPRDDADAASSLELHDVQHVFRTNYPLALQVTPGRCFAIRAGFDRTALTDTAVIRLLGHVETALGQFVTRLDATLGDLCIASAPEIHQARVEWNDTAAAMPAMSIPAIFEAIATQSPGRIALASGDRLVTYGELNALSNRCARYLTRRLQPSAECPIGIGCHDPLLAVLGTLGTLKAGCACVPLEISGPADRLRRVVRDSGVRAILCDERAAPGLDAGVPLLRVEQDAGAIALEDEANVGIDIAAARLAYVIYTSGSTGVPKGVEIPHRAIVRLICGTDYVRFGDSQTLLQLAPVTFDASFFELWGALLHGGRCVLAPSPRQSVADVGGLVRRHRISTMWLTASLFNEIIDAQPDALAGVSQLIVGGEALSPSHVSRAHDALPDMQLVNGYGPTESATFTNCYRIPGNTPGDRAIPLGLPIANTRSFVVDRDLQLAPIGVPGELYVAGGGLARGYRGSPNSTAERFVPDPFSSVPGARIYRTGDRASYRADGTIDFLGRIDDQVKIRGHRIEPAEIEAVLTAHPVVRQAVVLPRVDGDARRLCAYLVIRDGSASSVAEIEAHLRSELPDYMIPAEWLVIDAMPLTVTGKVDRARLLTLRATEPPLPVEYVAPRTPVEELLATLWASVLGRPRVGITDSFLSLGGHSLLAVRLVSRIRDAFAADVPLALMFQALTVAEQAVQIERMLGSGATSRLPLRPARRDSVAPLSFGQERLWMLDQFDPGCPAYNVPVAIALTGRLDQRALAESLRQTVCRHEILRTTYHLVEGQPTQHVHLPAAENALPIVDLQQLAASARQRELERICGDEASWRFDLTKLPMLRCRLVQLAGDNHVLLLTMHHIAADAWSMNTLVQEVTEHYAAACEGRAPALSQLTVQYADYAIWQREWLSTGALEHQLAYWRTHLSGCPALDLPTDRPRPPIQTFRGGRATAVLAPEVSASLDRLARDERATQFMTLLAAFAVLLHRLTGQVDFAIGTPVANRAELEVEPLIGFFVNTLVLRLDVSGDPSFRDIVSRVRREALNAFAHHDVPFEKLVAELQPARSLAATPLFQALFSFHAGHTRGIEHSHLRGTLVHVDNGSAKFDLTLAVVSGEQGLQIALEYNRELFDATTAQRWVASYAAVLAEVAAAPARRLATLGAGTAAARHQLAVEWNDTARGPLPAPHVPALLARAVAAHADAPALDFEGERWSYAALFARAYRWARQLRTLPDAAAPEMRVGISLPRQVELVVAVLAVLHAGAAYVPLDPRLPLARRRALVAASGVRVVFGDPADWPAMPGLTVLPMTADPATAATPLAVPIAAAQLAAVLFTSGSTGAPKGVALTHGGLVRLLQWVGECYPPAVLQGVAAATALSFDLSVVELLGPLCYGGRIVLVDSALELAAMGAERGVRLVNTVPSAMAALVAGDGVPASVRVVNLAGEPLGRALVEALYARGIATVWNLYGPTEDSTYATGGIVPRRGPVGIGRSLPARTAYVVDAHGALAPLGVAGELYLGGEGLARGYVGDPAATAAAWVPHPWSATPGARLYRTGDRVRRAADGTLHYLGRRDHQIKLRGYRIELGEIETALRHSGLVADAAVRLATPPAGAPQLVAYYVPPPGAAVDPAALRQALAQTLPAYMLPQAWHPLPALPRTPTGKLDRAALPNVHIAASGAPPQTEREIAVASIWSEVLHRTDLPRDVSFFEAGGQSLSALQVVSRLRQHFGVTLPIRSIFEHSTIASLAGEIERLMHFDARAPAEDGGLRPLSSARSGALSPLQERLWFLSQIDEAGAAYNLSALIRMRGQLDAGRLVAAIEAVVTRHDTLRTRFALAEGQPIQIVDHIVRVAMPVIDLRDLPPVAREREAASLAHHDARRSFDLGAAPLLRLTLLQLADQEHALAVSMHHIIGDAWSIAVFTEDVAALYGALKDGRPSPLAPLDCQYRDCCDAQHAALAGGLRASQLAYWTKQLAGPLPVLRLSRHGAPARGTPFQGATRHIELPADLAVTIRDLGKRHGVTVFMTLLAALQTLLHRHAGERDIAVGTDVSNRYPPETEHLIGFFVNTLIIRCEVDDRATFAELLQQVRRVCLDALTHRDLPFHEIVRALNPARDPERNPLFQVMFILQNAPEPEWRFPDLEMTCEPTSSQSSAFDLTVALAERPAGSIAGTLRYRTDVFDAATIEGLTRDYLALLRQVAANPDGVLGAIVLQDKGPQPVASAALASKETRTMAPSDRLAGLRGIKRQPTRYSTDALLEWSSAGPNGSTRLPVVVTPATEDVDLNACARAQREAIDARLLQDGALLFRGFRIAGPAEFEQFAGAICDLIEYGERSSPRSLVQGRIYTSTEHPADQEIFLHNEQSYTLDWPMKILFWCVQPAMRDGRTPIADSRRVLARLSSFVVDKFTALGVLYVRNYGDGLGLPWQEVFQTTDRSAVEAHCRQAEIEFEWKDGERLRTRQRRPAVRTHPRTGERVWFNHAVFFHPSTLDRRTHESLARGLSESDLPFNTLYGDGTAIEPAVLDEIREAYRAETTRFDWQKGDVLLADNMLVAHGRERYEGPRRIAVAMGDRVAVA